MRAHALLSPSSGSRWLVCTPSARLEDSLPEQSSSYSDEGDLAHKIGALLILRLLRRVKEQNFKIQLAELQRSPYYEKKMLEYCEDYAAYVMEVYAVALKRDRNALIFVETWLDLSKYVPEGFGTADVLIMCNGKVWFIDLKYGQGVPVDSVENKQLMLYGLGALDLSELYVESVEDLSLTIYQPRIDNTSTWETSAFDLELWADTDLKEKAALAFEGKGEYVPGSHCQFCAAKGSCRANAEHKLALAKYEFAKPTLLEPDEIANILDKYEGLINWAKAVKEHALKAALNGTEFPGYKVVVGKSNRYIRDPKEAVKILKTAGYSIEDIYHPLEMRGIQALENLMGKKDFGHYLNELIEKPYGAPALVPLANKGKPYDKSKAAADIFQVTS